MILMSNVAFNAIILPFFNLFYVKNVIFLIVNVVEIKFIFEPL